MSGIILFALFQQPIQSGSEIFRKETATGEAQKELLGFCTQETTYAGAVSVRQSVRLDGKKNASQHQVSVGRGCAL